MKKIAILPLDNRPCCYDFTESFGKFGAVEVLQPEKEILGEFTYFGDVKRINQWLKAVAGKVDGLILAVDQLAYGGLIPSRMMERDFDKCEKIVQVIREIRKEHPDLLIYGVNVLMRISVTTKNKQFLSYWKSIFRYSQLYDRLHRLKEVEVEKELKEMEAEVPSEVLQEYLQARERNHQINQLMIDWVADGTLDFLAITQEDASAIGMHLLEQRILVKKIFELNVQRRVLVYPGADEATQTLLARMVQFLENKKLKIYPKYGSTSGKLEVAKFEDRPVEESVISHITAAGALVADNVRDADLVLYVNTPIGGTLDGNDPSQEKAHFNSRHPLLYFIESIDHDLREGRAVSIADISFPNASDMELVSFLLTEKLYYPLTAYAGWNTAGNTLGTCISHSIIHLFAQRNQRETQSTDVTNLHQRHLAFMTERLLDEWAYQAQVRGKVNLEITEKFNINGANLENYYETVNQTVKEEMQPYFTQLVEHLREYEVSGSSVTDKREGVQKERGTWKFEICELPWNRTFELRVKVSQER
ncbi:DUF4127 family protein [Evansella tamaricis]|uniref:DUF4127 family protein n=1 Tax=Evansella tamaricis TaxID=2069301 RepID=A0ABS6JG92_9BACI|nr:DUF4127 family protein [Evansella tamaricis]MBU9712712.1 DUF4127 family protein [Evansella tamaricis]